MIALLLATALLSQPLTTHQIEDSVVPFVDQIEDVTHLNPKKYSNSQFKSISRALEHKEDCVRLATFNLLRIDIELNENKDPMNQWDHRLSRIVATIQEMNPDLIGTQEVAETQLNDLLEQLGNTYSFYGKPRKDGEYNGIFYRTDRFEPLNQNIFKVPDIEKDQLITFIEFKDLKTDKIFGLYNTHVSFSNINFRDTEARYIANLLKNHSIPVLFSADVNTFPNRPEEPFPAYDGDYVEQILTQYDLKDSKDVSLLGHLGPLSTFTNVPGPDKTPFRGTGTPGVILDHIYVSPEISVLVHAIQPIKVDHRYPSDHMPVFIDFFIDKE